MTDTGQIPPPQPQSGSENKSPPQKQPTIVEVTVAVAPAVQSVEIIDLPAKLQKIIREIKLEGQIAKIDLINKSINIYTPQGNIVVSAPPIQPTEQPLYNGQQVSLTLPVGDPPKIALVQIFPVKIAEEINIPKEKLVEPIISTTISQDLKVGDKIVAIIIKPTETVKFTEEITKKYDNAPLPKPVLQDTDKLREKTTLTKETNPLEAKFNHLKDSIFIFEISNNTERTKKPIIKGIVTNHTPKGLPIITIQPNNIQVNNPPELQPNTNIVLQTPINIPVNTILEFSATKITPKEYTQFLQEPPTTAIENPFKSSDFLPLISPTWPALQEVFQIPSITVVAPEVITAIQSSLPSSAVPAKILPTTLFFLAALRLGNIENWIGEKHLDTIRKAGGKDLVSKLTNDFSNISRQSQETLSGEWRGVSIPMQHQEEIEMMQLFTKQQNEDENENNDDENKKVKTTRFLLNLQLSQMGKMQLDGMLRGKKTLDIFLRTEEKLPEVIRQDVLQAFNTGLTQAGLESGQIIFQNNHEQWIDIKLENPSNTELTI